MSQLTIQPTNYRLDIQGLRAVAILMVVTFHCGLPVSGGFTGVDVFFVISGFVITEMLERRLRSGQKLGFREFYARRIRRLFPALAVLVAVVAVVASAAQSPLSSLGNPTSAQQTTAETGIGAVFIVANVVIYRIPGGGYFANQADLNPLLHTWSLSVEEQFYLVFPALLALAWLLGRHSRYGKQVTTIVLSLVGLASFAGCVALTLGLLNVTAGGDPASLAFYSSPTRAWEFSAGAIAALVVPTFRRFATAGLTILSLIGVAMLLVSAFVLTDRMEFPGYLALVPVIGTVLLLLGGSKSDGSSPVARLLATPPMVKIGDLSYSWYLWHWPAIVFTTLLLSDASWLLVLAAIAALGIAWLSYRFIENPIRRNLRIRGKRVVLLTAVCVAVPAALCTLLYVGSHAYWWQPPLVSMAAQVEPVHAAGCAATTPAEYPVGFCAWNTAAVGPPIVLIGDSNAEQFSEAVVGAGEALGRPVVLASIGGCPFVALTIVEDGALRNDCQPFMEKTIAWLQTQPMGDVFIADSSDLYITGSWAQLGLPGATELATTDNQKAKVYTRGLTASLGALKTTGLDVTLIQTIPHFAQWSPDECPTAQLVVSTTACGRSDSLRSLALSQAIPTEAQVAAATAAGVPRLDLSDELCPGAQCATNVGDTWRYKDGLHISVGESEQLTPVFQHSVRTGT